MSNTHYVEPTGLSIHNVSTARDLTKLLIASKQYPLIGQLSTTREETATFANPAYTLPFRNTNHLVYRDNWNIQLTKTGFTNAAGHCLAMRTVFNGKPVALVVMDALVNTPTSRMQADCAPGLRPGKPNRFRPRH
jgi:D-alanyl-D-alanine endopeptidase (penicillin-binding protein 7)